MSEIDRVVLEISTLQDQLNELLEDSNNRNTEKLIEISKSLDKLIVNFYCLKHRAKCEEDFNGGCQGH